MVSGSFGATTATINFGTAVVNPLIALISVGQGGLPVTYNFGTSAFTVVSNNNSSCAFYGCGSYTTSGNTIAGTEFSGVLRFNGTFTSLTFSTNNAE